MPPPRPRVVAWLGLGVGLLATAAAPALADVVVLKNGLVYRGSVDKEPPVVQVFDSLKRVVIRDTKVQKIDGNDAPEKLERFLPQQPLEVHAGAMPPYAINIQATPWDETGRRTFKYLGPRMKKPLTMTQGIIALDPQTIRYRGIDGFWQGQALTTQVPKASVLASRSSASSTRGTRTTASGSSGS